MPELSEVKEELAEQTAEGGTQAQSGTQGQVGFQLPGGTFVNPGIGFPTLQAFPVSSVHMPSFIKEKTAFSRSTVFPQRHNIDKFSDNVLQQNITSDGTRSEFL